MGSYEVQARSTSGDIRLFGYAQWSGELARDRSCLDTHDRQHIVMSYGGGVVWVSV